MISDPDIWRAAQLVIKRHGEDAAIAAAQRADELLAGQAMWTALQDQGSEQVETSSTQPSPYWRVQAAIDACSAPRFEEALAVANTPLSSTAARAAQVLEKL